MAGRKPKHETCSLAELQVGAPACQVLDGLDRCPGSFFLWNRRSRNRSFQPAHLASPYLRPQPMGHPVQIFGTEVLVPGTKEIQGKTRLSRLPGFPTANRRRKPTLFAIIFRHPVPGPDAA